MSPSKAARPSSKMTRSKRDPRPVLRPDSHSNNVCDDAAPCDDMTLQTVLLSLGAHALAIDHEARLVWADPALNPLYPSLADDAIRARIRAQIDRLRNGQPAERITLNPASTKTARHWEMDIFAWTPPANTTSRIAAVALCRDSSLEYNLRLALMESRQRYKDLVESSSDFTWECDPEGTFIFVSPGGAWGYEADELIGRRGDTLLLEREEDSPFTTRRPIENMEVWLCSKEGQDICALVACVPLYDDDDQWRGARGLCRDITALRERERELDQTRQRDLLLAYIVRAIRDVANPKDMLNAAVAVSAKGLAARACRLYRCQDNNCWHQAAEYGDPPSDTDILETRLNDPGTLIRLDHATHQPIALKTQYQSRINGALVLWRRDDQEWSEDEIDIISEIASQLGIAIEQADHHETLERLSTRDSLTGLYNRRAFMDIMKRRIAHIQRTRRPGALCYIDFDNFKIVNDSRGHQDGDRALKKLSELLVEHTRANDLVARLGGDEFALWLEETSEKGAKASARKLLEHSGCLSSLSGSPDKPLGISVGVAIYHPGSKESLQSLLQRADEAMYRIKKKTKGNFALAPPANND